MSRGRVPTSFPQWHLAPSEVSFKKANHFTMTTLNIRSDPMANWECATQFRPPLNFSANVTHAHCILGSSKKLASIETPGSRRRLYICSFISFHFIYPRYPFKYSNKYLISQGAVLKTFYNHYNIAEVKMSTKNVRRCIPSFFQ